MIPKVAPTSLTTTIAGVTFGGEIIDPQTGQTKPYRQWLLEILTSVTLPVSATLVREPSNEYDADAIAVYIKLRGQSVKLGYIPNKAFCVNCKKPAIPYAKECKFCGALTVRDGLAKNLSYWIDRGITYKASIISIHGGGDKSVGAVLSIDRIN